MIITIIQVTAAPVIRSRKKLLVAMKSLPIVPGILFRGFPNLMKRNMILVQSFATLFKLIDFSFPNRDTAFKLKLHEEIAEIGQVSINTNSKTYTNTYGNTNTNTYIGLSKYAAGTRVHIMDN